MNILRSLLVYFVIAAICPALNATDVYLRLMAHGQRVDVGVAGFVPASPTMDESKYARQIQEILRYDLLFARYFNILDEGPLYTGKDEEIKSWADQGADMLVCGKISINLKNIEVDVQLFDTESRQIIWEKTFTGTTGDWRRLAHEINDELIMRITGERGIAHTRIVFSNNVSGSKELYTIDYDGGNLMRMTDDKSINLLPCWSPDGKEIVYTTYRFGNPDLCGISCNADRRRVISQRQGLNTAASFSPDGNTIALTISRGKTPALYLIKRSGEIIRQLTFGNAAATSPSFAPNSREIAYISDDPGYPQLYIMNIEGGNNRRLPARGYCDSPAWSPRGDRIVFTMRQGRGDNRYDLYVYALAEGTISRLTQNEGDNENPSWSPDGRFIVFSSTRSGRSQLYIAAADGSGARKLGSIPGNSSTPDWSP